MLLKAPALSVVPLLAPGDCCALAAASKPCKSIFDEDRIWAELLVDHFSAGLLLYRDAALASSTPQVQASGRDGREELLALCEGGARQAYKQLVAVDCEPFVLQPRARLILEIHELRDWNRHSRTLLSMRQAERISTVLANHDAATRLRDAMLPETLELIALQAVAAGGRGTCDQLGCDEPHLAGDLSLPAKKLQEGMARTKIQQFFEKSMALTLRILPT
ncbi:unnamed protein product [Effrenium voratum]|uniref:Uncharacterized protein n=1 Tax=Effrenium voratum TaxID=2562239 RepID=A0AA36IQ97_9DINO|nr:unnamed protein product [Effrenium voratum]CAJ1392001.1 unnamed protein product [Effrenium voratum]CAJ1417683.1 unnamed protein product [Effrenium voratum]